MGKQIKRCSNPICMNAQPKKKLDAKFRFCPVCGSALNYVCADCGKPIEIAPEDKKTTLCSDCLQKKNENTENKKQIAVAAGAGAAAVAGGIVWMKVVMPTVSTIEKVRNSYSKIKKGHNQREGFGSSRR